MELGVAVPHQDGSDGSDQDDQQGSQLYGSAHVIYEVEDGAALLRIFGQYFLFQLLAVEQVFCFKLDLVFHQDAVRFEHFCSEIKIYKQHCHEQGNEDGDQ